MTLRFASEMEDFKPIEVKKAQVIQRESPVRSTSCPGRDDPSTGRHATSPVREYSPEAWEFLHEIDLVRYPAYPGRHQADPVRPDPCPRRDEPTTAKSTFSEADPGQHTACPVREDICVVRHISCPRWQTSADSKDLKELTCPGRPSSNPVRETLSSVWPTASTGREDLFGNQLHPDDGGPVRRDLGPVRGTPTTASYSTPDGHDVGDVGYRPPQAMFSKKKDDPADSKYKNFIKLLRSLNMTLPFGEALSERLAYTRYLKSILSNKQSIYDLAYNCYAIFLSNHCSINSSEGSLMKLKDPGRFAITIGLGGHNYKALCDLGASASLFPPSIWKQLGMGELEPVNMKIFMADGSSVKAENF